MSARLYVDLVNTHQSIPDREGIEVDDVGQAKVAVAEMLEEHRQEDASTAQEWSGWTLSVRDGAGQVLFSVDLDGHVQPHSQSLRRSLTLWRAERGGPVPAGLCDAHSKARNAAVAKNPPLTPMMELAGDASSSNLPIPDMVVPSSHGLSPPLMLKRIRDDRHGTPARRHHRC